MCSSPSSLFVIIIIQLFWNTKITESTLISQEFTLDNVLNEANYYDFFPLLKMVYLVKDIIICRIFTHIPQKLRHSKQSKLFCVLFRLDRVDESFFKMTAPLPLRRDAKVMQTKPGFDFLWRFPMEVCTGGHPCRFQRLLLRGLGSGTDHKLSTKTVGDKYCCGESVYLQGWAVPIKPATHPIIEGCREKRVSFAFEDAVLVSVGIDRNGSRADRITCIR